MLKLFTTTTNTNPLYPYIFDGEWIPVYTEWNFVNTLSLIALILVLLGFLATMVGMLIPEPAVVMTGFISMIVGILCVLATSIFNTSFNMQPELTSWAETHYGLQLTNRQASSLLEGNNIRLTDGTIITFSQVEREGQILVKIDGGELKTNTEASPVVVSKTEELAAAENLYRNDIITKEEYDTLKKEILNR